MNHMVTAAVLVLAAIASPPPGVGQEPGRTIDAVRAQEVVRGTAELVKDRYVDAELAGRIADSLHADVERGRFARIGSAAELAASLTRRLQELSGDGHLWVRFTGSVGAAPPAEEPVARAWRAAARTNHGFAAVRILPGNVGLLELESFVRPEAGGATAGAAMAFLSGVDALILDLRRNAGGSPDMAVLLASYIFEPGRTHLFDIYSRPEDRTSQYWTVPHGGSPRLAEVPVYLLTSAATFSAGEGLAYVLQQLERGVVVGEATAGAANPGREFPVGEDFMVFVAQGRVIHPATGGSWQGTGVIPDIPAAPDRALIRAHLLALEALAAGADAATAAELRALASALSAEGG